MTDIDYSRCVNLTTPNRNHQNLNKTRKKTTKPLLNMFERLAASDASVLSTCQVQARAPRQVFLSNVLDGSRRSCLSINLWYPLITWPTWPLWFGTKLCLAAWRSPGTLCNLLALWKELPLTPQPALCNMSYYWVVVRSVRFGLIFDSRNGDVQVELSDMPSWCPCNCKSMKLAASRLALPDRHVLTADYCDMLWLIAVSFLHRPWSLRPFNSGTNAGSHHLLESNLRYPQLCQHERDPLS